MRAGRVLAWVAAAWSLAVLVWHLAVQREPGTFVATGQVCAAPGDRACHPVGTWTSEDGRTVLRGAALEGSDLPVGTVRPATRDRALGPWPAPEGEGVVHERGSHFFDVVVASVLLTVVGSYLWFDARGGPGRAGRRP